MTEEEAKNLLTFTADIVAAHVSHNNVAIGDMPEVIARVYEALSGLGVPEEDSVVAVIPAVAIRSSVKPEYVVCLEDGKKMKMLKRHLRTYHDMSPAEYRAKWQLPSDYPLVAPNYAKARRNLALRIGLGRTRQPATSRKDRRSTT